MKKVVGEYITFAFIEEDGISVDIFAEKIFDYFEKVELKTDCKFEKLCGKYASAWDDAVEKYVPNEPSAKKGEAAPPLPRSLKYYRHARDIKNSRNFTMKQLADYTRIVMSLYMGAIRVNMKPVDEYEFSMDKLDLDKILSSLKVETVSNLIPMMGKKNLFDIEDLYCTDTAFFIMTMIMFYYMKSKEDGGED